MSLGTILREAREHYQKRTGKGQKEVQKELFEGKPEKLDLIEADKEIPPKEDATRMLDHYGVSLARRARALESYQLGERLSELVKTSGYTKYHVAERAGMSYHHLARLLSGTRRFHSPERLIALARLLNADDTKTRELVDLARFPGYDLLMLERSEATSENCDLVEHLRRRLTLGIDRKTEGFVDSPMSRYAVDSGNVAYGPTGVARLATQVIRKSTESPTTSASSSAPDSERIKISIGRVFVGDRKLLQQFLAAICDALEAGIPVDCLIPPPKTASELVNIVVRSLVFLGINNESYTLRVDKQRAEDSTADRLDARALRMVVSPNSNVLFFLPKEKNAEEDAAALLADEGNVFENHFDSRFREGKTLLRLFRSDSDSPARLQKALREAEAKPGPRMIMRRRPPNTMIPLDFWEWEAEQIQQDLAILSSETVDPWRYERLALKRFVDDKQSVTGSLEALRREKAERIQRLSEVAESFPVREIYSKNSYEAFFRNAEVPLEIRRATIDHTIEWLEAYPHYMIAITEQDTLTLTAFFGVHSEETVFLSVWREKERADYLQVEDSLLVVAFKDYFITKWNELPAADRLKSEIKSYLTGLSDSLE